MYSSGVRCVNKQLDPVSFRSDDASVFLTLTLRRFDLKIPHNKPLRHCNTLHRAPITDRLNDAVQVIERCPEPDANSFLFTRCSEQSELGWVDEHFQSFLMWAALAATDRGMQSRRRGGQQVVLELGWGRRWWGWRGLCSWGQRQTDLSKPTYLLCVIASLLGTVGRGRNRGYDTFKNHCDFVLWVRTPQSCCNL